MMVAQLATAAVGWVLTPILLATLGIERYGALVFLQLILSYASLADIGMGGATTRFAAAELARGDEGREATIIWTGTAVTAVSSGLLALVALGVWAWCGFPGLDRRYLSEMARAAAIFAAPFLLRQLSAVWNTSHTIRLRFGRVAAINYGGVFLQQVLVGAAAWNTGRLDVVVIAITAASAATLLANILEAVRTVPILRLPRWSSSDARSMLVFGAFGVTLSLADLLLTSGERLVLTAMAGAEDLARFSLAYTLASVVMIGPLPALNALLPAFSRHAGSSATDAASFDALYRRSLVTLYAGSLCCIAVLITAARPLLQVWVGPELAIRAAPVAVVLCAGMLPQVVGQLHGTVLYARGRPNLVAQLRWMEVPAYLCLGWILVHQWGLMGAAAAWTLRWTADALLTAARGRQVGGLPLDARLAGSLAGLAAVVFACLALAMRLPHDGLRIVSGLAVAGGNAAYVWFRLLTPEDRSGLLEMLATGGRAIRR
jgi:O-antigen/teichoic acid export membrane protein